MTFIFTAPYYFLQVNYSTQKNIVMLQLQHLTKNVIICFRGGEMDDLFKNISLKNRSKILQSLEANTTFYKKNTTIFDNVNKENLICIVLDGYIQIVKNDYNGNEIIIEKFEKGSIFGSITSPICNNEYDVITKEDSKIIIIDYNTILSIDTISSNLYNQFLKNLLLILNSRFFINV